MTRKQLFSTEVNDFGEETNLTHNSGDFLSQG